MKNSADKENRSGGFGYCMAGRAFRQAELNGQGRTTRKLGIAHAQSAGRVGWQPMVAAVALDRDMASRMCKHPSLREEQGKHEQNGVQESVHGYILPSSVLIALPPNHARIA
jgi:hypothetical protein